MSILKNKATFELFFKENYEILCRFAFTFLKDADEAEEIVQNSFVKLWEDKDKLQIDISSKAYLFTTVRNASLNRLKHGRIKNEYKASVQHSVEYKNQVEETVYGNELQAKINEAINKMPEKRREVFNLIRFEGLKYKEVAEQLGISPKTVENHMGSAIKFLKDELQDFLPMSAALIVCIEIGGKLF